MDHGPEIMDLANQLAGAVETALNPGISNDKRLEAYSACEEFKEKSPLSIPCSVYLSLHGSHLVRHFGLQLMEYCVKFKWYEIDQTQKISIKEATMSLLRSSEGDIREHVHLRDALSRVIVEMMKREWPQHWSSLLPELFQIALESHIQAEIVLLIFLRFVEDVVVLQTLEYAQRRRDLLQHLTLNLESIITFLLNLMARHYELYVPESIRVMKRALTLFSEIVEFATVNTIVAEETRALPVLCNLLASEHYQLETAECLLRIANKKGKHEDKRIVCKMLLRSNLINSISRLDLMLQNGALNERSYLFIQKVSELLSSVCSLLCTVLKSETDNLYDIIEPDVFVILLEILLTLCKHSSLIVACNINSCWTCFFKHTVLKKDTNVSNYIPKWVSVIPPKLVKIPYNPERVIPLFQDCYNFLRYDFESVESFNAFYCRYRMELNEAFRHLTAIAPLVVFACSEQWLSTLVAKTALTSALCSPESEEYLEWEALSTNLEAVVNSLPAAHGISLDRGIRLLDLCFSLKPADPCIASFLLSCISPLMYFVHNAPADVTNVYVPRLLERVFQYMVFQLPNEEPFKRSRGTKTLRKHAGCLLLKLSCKYSTMFVPFFDSIHKAFADCARESGRLTKLEQIIFFESLIQISNGFCDYESQSMFVKKIFYEVNEYWMKITGDVFGDHNKFVSFIGLDAKPGDYPNTYKNRSELLYCVDVISAIIKRSSWPASLDAARNGGFVVNALAVNSEHPPVYRSPAQPHILPAIPGIFSLIRMIHTLWTNEVKSRLPPGYENVHDMTEHEVKSLSGTHVSSKDLDDAYDMTEGSENVVRMQSFLVNLYELCFTVLSKACYRLGTSFYELPNFVPSFGASVFCHLDAMPDYRLRIVIKNFIKPFVYYCPPDKYDPILVPIMGYFSRYMFERLANKYQYLNECRENGKWNEDDSEEDSKEVIEHHLITHLCREYMDVVKLMMLKTTSADAKQVNGHSNEDLASPTGSQTNLSNVNSNIYDSLSDLGVKLLRCETARDGILKYVMSSISWSDSTNSLKASMKIVVIAKQLFADSLMTSQLAKDMLTSLLQGLQVHGQHDANLGSLLNGAVQIYQLLRPVYREVRDLMEIVPDVVLTDLDKFDAKMLNVVKPPKIDKSLREQFRKLVNSLIGRNIGQLFKRKEAIRDLPKVEIVRLKGENLLHTAGNENDIGIANFFK